MANLEILPRTRLCARPASFGALALASRALSCRRNFRRWLSRVDTTEPSPDRRWALREAGFHMRHDAGFLESLPHEGPPVLAPLGALAMSCAALAVGLEISFWLSIPLLAGAVFVLGYAGTPHIDREILGDQKSWVRMFQDIHKECGTGGAVGRVARATKDTSQEQDEAALERAVGILGFETVVDALEVAHHCWRAARSGVADVELSPEAEELLGRFSEALGLFDPAIAPPQDGPYVVRAPNAS